MPTLPRASAEAMLPYLKEACLEAEITTPQRLAAFLAQIGHESNDLRWWEERGNYCQNYDTGSLAKRLGNTPEADGDGCRLRGRSPIQLTGADNYRAAGAALGIDLLAHPQRAAHLDVGFRIAGWFWASRRLNALADAGDFDGITKRINGGTNNKADRDARHARARAALGLS